MKRAARIFSRAVVDLTHILDDLLWTARTSPATRWRTGSSSPEANAAHPRRDRHAQAGASLPGVRYRDRQWPRPHRRRPRFHFLARHHGRGRGGSTPATLSCSKPWAAGAACGTAVLRYRETGSQMKTQAFRRSSVPTAQSRYPNIEGGDSTPASPWERGRGRLLGITHVDADADANRGGLTQKRTRTTKSITASACRAPKKTTWSSTCFTTCPTISQTTASRFPASARHPVGKEPAHRQQSPDRVRVPIRAAPSQ